MNRALCFVLLAGLLPSVFAGKYSLHNDYTPDIVDMFFCSAGSEDWGDDRPRDGEVLFSDSTRVFGVENGHYDIKLKDSNGRSWIDFSVSIFGFVESDIEESDYNLIDDDLD